MVSVFFVRLRVVDKIVIIISWSPKIIRLEFCPGNYVLTLHWGLQSGQPDVNSSSPLLRTETVAAFGQITEYYSKDLSISNTLTKAFCPGNTQVMIKSFIAGKI